MVYLLIELKTTDCVSLWFEQNDGQDDGFNTCAINTHPQVLYIVLCCNKQLSPVHPCIIYLSKLTLDTLSHTLSLCHVHYPLNYLEP